MTFESKFVRAVKPAVGYIRPVGLTVLAAAYMIGGVLFALYGLAWSFEAPPLIGEARIKPGAARMIAVLFGGGLAWVGFGFYQLRAAAWRIFVCAVWVGIGLEALWLMTAFARGGLGLQYVAGLLVDGLLLFYVYKQRHLFIN